MFCSQNYLFSLIISSVFFKFATFLQKVEAKVDTIPDGIALFDHNVVFHIGKDVNVQLLSFSNINWQQTGDLNYHFPLKLDMQTFLQNGTQTIDLQTEYTSHTASGQEVISLKVIENFKAAISEY